jgi:predicted transcriptional regulator
VKSHHIGSDTHPVVPIPDISDSEWSVMEAVWAASPQTASELTKTLYPTTHWAENTVRTLLSRLVEKRAVQTGENQAGTRTYFPAVKREATSQRVAYGHTLLKVETSFRHPGRGTGLCRHL